MHKLVEREAFIDSLGFRVAVLKDVFLFAGFTAFCVFPV